MEAQWQQRSYLFGSLLLSLGQFSRSVVSNSLPPHGLQHPRPPCPSPTPRVYSNSCPLSQWCHPTVSSSVFSSSHLQSFPGSGGGRSNQVELAKLRAWSPSVQVQGLALLLGTWAWTSKLLSLENKDNMPLRVCKNQVKIMYYSPF